MKWKAFLDPPRPLRAISDRHYTRHSSLLGSIWKVSLYLDVIALHFIKKDLLKIRSQVMGPDDSKRKMQNLLSAFTAGFQK